MAKETSVTRYNPRAAVLWCLNHRELMGQHFVLCASLPLEDSSRGWCLHCLYSCQDTTILLGSISLSALVTVFFIFPILLEVTWYLIVVLIRISVLTNNLSIFFCVCVGHFYKFVGEMSIQIFRLFINW